MRDKRRPLRDRIRIAVEGNHSSRPRPKQSTGVAAGAEGAVDVGFAGPDGKAGKDLVDQHRQVRCRGNGGRTHDDAPRSSSRKRAISFMSSGMLGSARNSLGFHSWKVSPTPMNNARSSIPLLLRIIGGNRIRPELS